jgi:two-component system alkaline phosphatase synthesis response regulator PhoP
MADEGSLHRSLPPMANPERKKRILLVEDEESLRSSLKLNFELEGYDVTTAARGSEAMERIRGARFDGVVLDVMLPDVDGFTICETMRLEGDRTPVLFLTARSTPQDRIRGLKSGEDHLGKPFELEELLLRVEKLLSRGETASPGVGPSRRSFGTNSVDFDSFEVVGQRGLRKPLTQREMMLLKLLMDRANEVVSREEILEKVWGYDVFPTTRTIDNFIVSFRKYFEVEPRDPQHFMSIRGVGYKFVP